MDNLGVQDPKAEFNKWMSERGQILGMNRDLNARSYKGESSVSDSGLVPPA
jgi:hypothetical protein